MLTMPDAIHPQIVTVTATTDELSGLDEIAVECADGEHLVYRASGARRGSWRSAPDTITATTCRAGPGGADAPRSDGTDLDAPANALRSRAKGSTDQRTRREAMTKADIDAELWRRNDVLAELEEDRMQAGSWRSATHGHGAEFRIRLERRAVDRAVEAAGRRSRANAGAEADEADRSGHACDHGDDDD
jgi:hypothetical protein